MNKHDKIMLIRNCHRCPERRLDVDDEMYCDRCRMMIPPSLLSVSAVAPDWCPLEDLDTLEKGAVHRWQKASERMPDCVREFIGATEAESLLGQPPNSCLCESCTQARLLRKILDYYGLDKMPPRSNSNGNKD